MTDAHDANPAGRLWGLLETTMVFVRQGSNVPVRNVWTEYLGLEKSDRQWFAALAEVFSLPGQISSAVGLIQQPVPPADVLLEPIAPIQQSLAPTGAPGTTVAQAMALINEGHLSTLRTCSYVLNSHEPQRTLNAEARAEVKEHAEAIIDLLLADTELPTELRRRIIAAAERIVSALNLYVIAGADAALGEWDRLIGSLVRDPQIVQVVRTNANHPALVRLRKLGGSLLVAMSIYSGPAAVMDATETYLELIPPATTSITSDSDGTPPEREDATNDD